MILDTVTHAAAEAAAVRVADRRGAALARPVVELVRPNAIRLAPPPHLPLLAHRVGSPVRDGLRRQVPVIEEEELAALGVLANLHSAEQDG